MKVSIVSAADLHTKVRLDTLIAKTSRCKFVVGQRFNDYLIAIEVVKDHEFSKRHDQIARQLQPLVPIILGGGSFYAHIAKNRSDSRISAIMWNSFSMLRSFGFDRPEDSVEAERLLSALSDELTILLRSQ